MRRRNSQIPAYGIDQITGRRGIDGDTGEKLNGYPLIKYKGKWVIPMTAEQKEIDFKGYKTAFTSQRYEKFLRKAGMTQT